jgi:tetrahydromethanopterin S-methyltransferase subunit D
MTLVASLLLGISACASQRPVLSSNAYLVRVGPSVAEREIDECLRLADAASAEGGKPGENVAADTATSSVVGAAAGGAGGAVVGQAARGAAAGAAGGAAAGLTHALLQGLFRSKQPDPYYRQFVDRCLREKGYQPAGWR